MKEIRIIGGGLAGLALGLALRRAGVPVRVSEAGSYPRHRVCGEFISGAGAAEWAALGVASIFAQAPQHGESAWFAGDRLVLERPLPEPATAISRHELDAALAQALEAAGGVIQCGHREPLPAGEAEGCVLACGRPKQPGRWLGLKAHYHGLPLRTGLEMHLGRGGYAGLTQLPGGRVNVCALLPAGPALNAERRDLLPAQLARCGLHGLAARLREAVVDPQSITGITHFALGWQEETSGALSIGDHAAIIPPFTGNGMSMAFQSALASAPALIRWARGDLDWSAARAAAVQEMKSRFTPRLRWAGRLHPLLLTPVGHACLTTLAPVLPFSWLFRRVR